MNKSKVIAIDIDGTICTEEKTFERSLAKPLPGSIENVNSLYDKGHTVILWTARGWEQYRMTHDWLIKHGFKFHALQMGKIIYDVFIDDRARHFVGWDKEYLNV